jgi:UDP-N-acetylglucosamine--N-acetylmuramyl-(pentapeptide) pyrophosphoryl-undecaprenol N-acetylglucosamine transferase
MIGHEPYTCDGIFFIWRFFMKRIILTGGGTAGHVTPNIALIPRLQELGYDIQYIGSYTGIEKELIEAFHIPYHGISSGKLRRYFSLQNFTDPFRVLKGLGEAKKLVRELKPDVIFSKGGFVSVPVVLAGKRAKVPVIIHESDMTPGLANKLAIPSATKVCCNFPETLENLPKEKAILTGSPIRQELLSGNKIAAMEMCGFSADKPVILVIGGSLGSVAVNTAVRAALPELLEDFQVVHLCGKGKLDESLINTKGYKQFEYVKNELRDIFAISDLVISRAGANAICELLALRKPNLLIPLSANASRGDQILNARSFERQGFSTVLEEEDVTKESLLDSIHKLYQDRAAYIDAMHNSGQQDSIRTIIQLIEEVSKS